MPRVLFAATILLAACATARPAPSDAPPPARILESGGELQLSQLPDWTVQVNGQQLQAFSMTEVPGDSRLQAAYAMADAAARAELLKAVAVGVASALHQQQDRESQTVSLVEAEVARGVLPGLPPAEHRWVKVEQGGTVVLRVFSKLTADRQKVAEAVTHSLESQPGGSDLAQRAVALIGRAQVSP